MPRMTNKFADRGDEYAHSAGGAIIQMYDGPLIKQNCSVDCEKICIAN